MQVKEGVRLKVAMQVIQMEALEQLWHGDVQLTQMVPSKNWLVEH